VGGGGGGGVKWPLACLLACSCPSISTTTMWSPHMVVKGPIYREGYTETKGPRVSK